MNYYNKVCVFLMNVCIGLTAIAVILFICSVIQFKDLVYLLVIACIFGEFGTWTSEELAKLAKVYDNNNKEVKNI